MEIWGGDAQVKLTGDTVFLTETSAGWRITSAACTPAGRGALRLRGGRAMRGVRVVFVGYLVVILLGIAYVTALGLMGR